MRKILVVISIGIALLSVGILFLMLFLFGDTIDAEQLVFGTWSVNVRALLIFQILIVMLIAIGNAFALQAQHVRWLTFFVLSAVSSLVAAIDFFWLPFVLLVVVVLTGLSEFLCVRRE